MELRGGEWGWRDWIGGRALLMGAISLREELLNACAKEGSDCGIDMAREKDWLARFVRVSQKKKRTEPKIGRAASGGRK